MGGGHIDDIVSSVDHPWFKSDRVTNDNSMRASPRNQCCTTGPMEQRKPY
jgi:hypothetical protein